MSYPNIPQREQLQNITKKAQHDQKVDLIQQFNRRYKIFKIGVIKILYELPNIAYTTRDTQYTSYIIHNSKDYCVEMKQYIERFNKEKTTNVILKYIGDDDKCTIQYDWN